MLRIRESHIRKIHYGTALGAIGLVALHISVDFLQEILHHHYLMNL